MTDLVSLKNHQTTRTCSDQLQALITLNVAALHEGRQVLESLTEQDLVASCRPAFRSTLGAHYRHLIEHYSCFLASLDRGQELICYASRPRDGQIETSKEYALQAMDFVIARLSNLSALSSQDTCSLVRDQDSLEPISTNLERELLFLQSHTVHHHAMIAAMCRLLDHKVPDNFGIAIATQAFEAAQQACERDPEPGRAS